MDECGIWRVGHGYLFETLLGMFGLGSHVGRVCAVCILQAGFRVRVHMFISPHRPFV